MPKVKKAIALQNDELVNQWMAPYKPFAVDHPFKVNLEDGRAIHIDRDDIEFRLKANEGWAAAEGKHAVVVLNTELTPELIRSGYARELNRFVQDLRKARDLERTDRIDVWIKTNADEINQAIDENVDYLKGETLAVSISQSTCDESGVEPTEVKVGDHEVTLWLRVAE